MGERAGLRDVLRCPWLADAAVAASVVAISLRVLDEAGAGSGFRAADATAFVLTGVGAAAIGFGRLAPLAALTVASLAGTLLAVRDDHVDVLPFVVTVLLFAVGSLRPRRMAVTGLGIAGAAFAVTFASRPADLPASTAVQSCVIFAVAWGIGLLTRSRRKALLGLVGAAEQQAATARALAAAEVDRATLSTAQERLTIARELHDVLAHSVSVITVQATVGEHLADGDPQAARQALATIGDVGRSTMRELRQILMLLRDEAPQTVTGNEIWSPTRGLDDLEALAATYRAAGLPVRATVRGAAHRLPPTTELCAYRIVQEALTNALRHAGPCTVDVVLEYGTDELLVSVSDDGRGPLVPELVLASAPEPAPGTPPRPRTKPETGHGLVGMRERTALLGGSFSAGAAAGGGFVVVATIPLEAS